MKVTCNIIKDLLPLYIKNIASSDTRALVEEHISYCESCKNEIDKLHVSNNISVDINVLPLRKIQSILRKKKYLVILFSVMLTLAVGVIVFGHLTAPKYIQYSENTITINENDEGIVTASFGNMVSEYDISKGYSKDNSGYICDITAWNSIWGKHVAKNHMPNNVVLNPNGEKITSVYYCLNNGYKNIVIYGENQNQGCGVVTLPNLFLTYYEVIAVIFALICGFILLVFRKNKKPTNIITRILFLPIAYLLGSIFVKGFNTASYWATRDLCVILLVMIPLYCAILIGINLLSNTKSK